MKTVEVWKVWAFLGALGTVAFIINQRQAHPPQMSQPVQNGLVFPEDRPVVKQTEVTKVIQTSETPKQSEPFKPIAAPVVSRILVWPADMTPTRYFHIPDPVKPVSGVIDDVLRIGEDLAIDVHPPWGLLFYTTNLNIEMLIDTGKGFTSLEQLQADYSASHESEEFAWWKKERTLRMRLKPGSNQDASYRMTLNKMAPEIILPPPPVQKFGNLSVSFRRFQRLKNDNQLLIDFDFQNTDKINALAVALHGPPNELANSAGNANIDGSVVDSGGSEYKCEDIAGLREMNSLPVNLTEIGPNETRHVSLSYVRTSSNNATATKSFRLQLQLVINSRYSSSQYNGYKATLANTMPPGCRIENLVIDIPAKSAQQ